jgi:pyruvate/2-oxoglutarate/acetoin dehydrogenase E1 component
MEKIRFRQAIVAAITDEMKADPTVILFGEDVAAAEGAFKASEGLLNTFGPERVRDTPISEMAFTGAGVGAAMMGLKPIVEIMFMEFLGVALDQLVTEGAKIRYLSKGSYSVPMVLRATTGSGMGFGCQHSQTLENWVAATPGLKVVIPSDVQSAYSLLRSAIQDPDPVVFLEPRILYAERGDIDFNIMLEIGKARVLAQGDELTIVAMGSMLNVARDAMSKCDVSVDLIDLATLVPWDRETVFNSVSKTKRLIVIEEAPLSGGWGSEICAAVTAKHFGVLKAAPFRITTPDVPVPFSGELEAKFIPTGEDVARQIRASIETNQVPQPWWNGMVKN